ncbi:MAG TPA: 4-hydroxybenzoyl-CoA thioesterase [Opitutae bacterium]|nr:4-hydroxybenzoyl-CoA thioesterase [Opitutae bacterium]
MKSAITLEHTVDFSETDMAGLVHFSNYFRWMEKAETALLKSLSIELIELSKSGMQGWPLAKAECDFMAPITFGDTVSICLWVDAIRKRTLHYRADIYKQEGKTWALCAQGRLKTIFAHRAWAEDKLSAETIPASVLTKISVCETPPKPGPSNKES